MPAGKNLERWGAEPEGTLLPGSTQSGVLELRNPPVSSPAKTWAQSVSSRDPAPANVTENNGFGELPDITLAGQNERGTTGLANIFNETGKKQKAPLVKKVSGQNANAARSLARNAKSYTNQGSLDEIFKSMGIFNKEFVSSGKVTEESAEVKEQREERLNAHYTSAAFQEGAIKLAFIRLIISGRIQYKESIYGIFDSVIGTNYALSNSSKLEGKAKEDFDKVLRLIADSDVESFDFHYRGGIRKLAWDMLASYILGSILPGTIGGLVILLMQGEEAAAKRAVDTFTNNHYIKPFEFRVQLEQEYYGRVYDGGTIIIHSNGTGSSGDLAGVNRDLEMISRYGMTTDPETNRFYVVYNGTRYTKDEFVEEFKADHFVSLASEMPRGDYGVYQDDFEEAELKAHTAELATQATIFTVIPITLIIAFLIKLIVIYGHSSNDKQLIIDVLIKLLDNFIRSNALIFRALGSESIQNIPLLYNDPDAKAIYYKYVNEMKRLGVKSPKDIQAPISMTNFLSGGDCGICQEKLATPFMETTEICMNHHKFHIVCIKAYSKHVTGKFNCPMCRAEVLPFARKIIKEYSPIEFTEGGSRKTRRYRKKPKTKKHRK